MGYIAITIIVISACSVVSASNPDVQLPALKAAFAQMQYRHVHVVHYEREHEVEVDWVIHELSKHYITSGLVQLTGHNETDHRRLEDMMARSSYHNVPNILLMTSPQAGDVIKVGRAYEERFVEYYWVLVNMDPGIVLDVQYWHGVLKDWDNVLVFQDTGREDACTVYSSNFHLMEEVAWWSVEDGLVTDWPDLYLNDRPNFNQRVLKITTMQWAFFQKKKQEGNETKWIGITINILDELARTLNFSYVLAEPPDGNWGVLQANGYFNGMVGLAQNGTVDAAGCALTINTERAQAVDMTVPFFFDATSAVINRPSESMLSKATLYVRPFKKEVWLCILSCIVCYSVILWTITNRSAYYSRPGAPPVPRDRFSYWNTVLYLYGAMLTQGGVWLPEAFSGRFLVGFFWLYSTIMVATYSGNLVAYLTVTSVKMPFDSLEEMVAQSAYSWGCEKRGNLFNMFRDSDLPLYKKIFDKLVPLESYAEGHERVKQGKFAFLTEITWFLDENNKDCNLLKMKSDFAPISYGMALPKNSPLTKFFNDRILRMFESGLLDRWVDEWYTMQQLEATTSQECIALGPVASASEVEIIDFQGALMLLGFGLVVAVTVLLLEIIIRILWRKYGPQGSLFSNPPSTSSSSSQDRGSMSISPTPPGTANTSLPEDSSRPGSVETAFCTTPVTQRSTLDMEIEEVGEGGSSDGGYSSSRSPLHSKSSLRRSSRPGSTSNRCTLPPKKPKYYSARERKPKEPDVFHYC